MKTKDNKINLKDLQMDELKTFLKSIDEPVFRGKQIFHWLYGGGAEGRPGGVHSFDEMTNLPKTLRQKLTETADTGLLTPIKVQISKVDGTRKYLFGLKDGNAIESVFMKYKYGNSICVSSQAGCRMGCKFCASGMDGLRRNLTAGEMIEQLLAAERDTGEKINHVVVMGTGEPFDNYENLAGFIRLLHEPLGLNLSMRNITVSTCGLVPMIECFAEEFPQVNLAISLHAPNDEIRGEMMPVSKAYPMDVLLEACRAYTKKTSRRITFEYTLVKGVNDGASHGEELAQRLKGMLCHVNLIPLNQVEETGLFTTEKKAAEAFRQILEKRGIPATIRRELGDDIDGACGQLRLGVINGGQEL
ncbi:MAG: 23S rRNA (adenine(2503)-C(2))-methyltransferase RlmN [Firmicutes bacterium]|nr:23S rRNA (adenine(2503)-C(2))-methyltransferase RlmN [Bacillota bacterium]